jgi:hypothetical protein
MGFNSGRKRTELVHVKMIAVGIVLHYLHRFQLFEPGFFLYPVLSLTGHFILQMSYIGYIPYIPDFIAEMQKISVKQVKDNCRACMTQVSIAVSSGATDIQSDKG